MGRHEDSGRDVTPGFGVKQNGPDEGAVSRCGDQETWESAANRGGYIEKFVAGPG